MMAVPSTTSPHESLLLATCASIAAFWKAARTTAASEVKAELIALEDLLRSIPGTQDSLHRDPSNENRVTRHTGLESHLHTLTTLLARKAPDLWSKRRWADTLAGVKDVKEQIAIYHAAQTTAPRAISSPAPNNPDTAMPTWLMPSRNSADVHAELGHLRHTDCCSWLLTSPQGARWVRGDLPWLLCTGEPGMGKSFLTSYLIDHLSTLEKQGVAFLYLDRMDALRQDPCSVFRSILSQLLALMATIPPLTTALYSAADSTPTLLWLRAAIAECAREFKCTWILIDGLEECADAHRTDILSTLWVLSGGGVRVFVTSTPGVVDLRGDESTEVLDLDGLAAASAEERMRAVRTVVERKVMAEGLRWGPAEDTKMEVEEAIERVVDRAGGVFLLAVRLAEYVASATTVDQLRARSKELPAGSMADHYAATFKALQDSADWPALAVLTQVLASPRPLTLGELNYLVGLGARGPEAEGSEGGGVLQLKYHAYTKPHVSELTKGLIIVTAPTGICRPAHASLLQTLETAEPGLLARAREDVLGTYFRLFAATARRGAAGSGDMVAKDLYQYAVHNWAMLLQMEPPLVDDRPLQTAVLEAFKSAPEALGEALRAAMRGRSVLPVVRTGRAGVLHACAFWGLGALAARVLAEDTDAGGAHVSSADGADGYGRTPLSWAAERGSADVLKALLDAGAVLDVVCGDYAQPPLCLAAMGGHTAAAEALLAAGADPNETSDNGQTPLSWAAEHGHLGTVRLLLNLMVDVNARDNAGRSALDWAVHSSHEPVVRLLVASCSRDIEVDGDAVWPLQPASPPRIAPSPPAPPPAIAELLRQARTVRARDAEACDSAIPVDRARELEEEKVERTHGGGGHWVYAFVPSNRQERDGILGFWLLTLVALVGAWALRIILFAEADDVDGEYMWL